MFGCFPNGFESLFSSIPNITTEEVVLTAPAEGHKPVSGLTDKFCEKLAHPHLFSPRKFGYKIKDDPRLKLHPWFYDIF